MDPGRRGIRTCSIGLTVEVRKSDQILEYGPSVRVERADVFRNRTISALGRSPEISESMCSPCI